MTLPTVLICDDDAERAEVWQRRISSLDGVAAALDVRHLPTDEFAAALRALTVRRENARDAQPHVRDDADLLDAASMLIVDYDLTISPSDTRGQSELDSVKLALRGQTGEQFAYLARCYSRAGFIVLVNQEYKRRTFDLTMQRFVHSYADLNVQKDDIISPELWTGTGDGYRPSHWPRLVDAPALHARRLAAAEPDGQILLTIGITGRDAELLTARQLDPLGIDDDGVLSATFSRLVEGVDGGLDPKDKQPDDMIRRSIGAAAAARWLESIVIPAQNVLSDAPHLAQRFPSLVAPDNATWESLGRLADPPLSSLGGTPVLAIEWASRPVWSVTAVRDAVTSAVGPLAEPADRAFCEDVSRFRGFSDAREYESDLPGTYDQRFVARLDDVAYHPLSRLLKRQ